MTTRTLETHIDSIAGETIEFDSGLLWELLDTLYDGLCMLDSEGRVAWWNRGAAEITGYASAEVLGLRLEDRILLHVSHDGKEDRMLDEGESIVADTLFDREGHEATCSFVHKEGHWMRVRARTMTVGVKESGIRGVILVFSDDLKMPSIKQRLRELRHLALFDPLTELGNRRYAQMSLRVRIDEMRRYGWPFGVLFIDLDHFKRINDTLGHEAGDRALRMVGKSLSHNVRPFDVVCRWGGEEFVIIVANIRLAQLSGLAENLRSLIANSCFVDGVDRVHLTISTGATTAREGDSETALIERADHLMYLSKNKGRNRVESE